MSIIDASIRVRFWKKLFHSVYTRLETLDRIKRIEIVEHPHLSWFHAVGALNLGSTNQFFPCLLTSDALPGLRIWKQLIGSGSNRQENSDPAPME